MALVLSGHGLRVDGGSFPLPKDITVKFITREGISVRDNVAGEVEADPGSLKGYQVVNTFSRGSLCPDYYLIDPWTPPDDLSIHPSPAPHFQFIPDKGEAYKLSWLLQQHPRILAIAKPLDVIWCACRATEARPSWQEALRK